MQNGTSGKPSLIVEFDPATGAMGWRFVNGAMPQSVLVNTLEIIKTTLVHQQLQAMTQTQPKPRVMLPDGSAPPKTWGG